VSDEKVNRPAKARPGKVNRPAKARPGKVNRPAKARPGKVNRPAKARPGKARVDKVGLAAVKGSPAVDRWEAASKWVRCCHHSLPNN
jgi:hypothetical protein